MLKLHRASADRRGDTHAVADNSLQVVVRNDFVVSPQQQVDLDAALKNENLTCSVKELSVSNPKVKVQGGYVLAVYLDAEQLDVVADAVLQARETAPKTTLIVAVKPERLLQLGQWLARRAAAGRLAGVRLMVEAKFDDVVTRLPERLAPVQEDNVIHMPASTEIENSKFRDFYVFSPELHHLVARMRGFAENGVDRAYLLGGPGSGKTSLAYYYYLVRKQGRFISVNLAAENTDDKAAVKSLLCGHVTGAFPGAGSRSGAFLLADDGLCFIDESHGVIGPVMEVLMEALDNDQYLPLGAAAKQPLRCAVLFASNRSWKHLQEAVNLEEFTRIGAATLEVPELKRREEDMIAVVAATLAKKAAACTTWKAPEGLSANAWELMRKCGWHGNVRAVIRVVESAFVDTASRGLDTLIRSETVQQGIDRWEPQDHHSHEIYARL